eukprot:CAMPEP_0168334108 /NCGR_PEP_ID=MMETSP0213-20121227/10047_1 /TAXON_ID=151035 /ORGANISM="Euplotes harpa, Strain FSP1.4" /LENGTH=158 /DNA_ID=CAMNT_0008338641 /DNA_START=82 /DNA_END=558 /DNA_ORIENTATION=-
MSSHKPGKGKHLKVNEEIYKTPGLLNVSKASRSSSKGMAKSRSTNVLPPIIGNDLKKIKEIFTKAKHYRDKMNHQNIQVKSFPKAGKGSPTKPPRTQSIPKMKNSSSSLKYPTYNIEKPSKKEIEDIKSNEEHKHSSNITTRSVSDLHYEISKFSSNQ